MLAGCGVAVPEEPTTPVPGLEAPDYRTDAAEATASWGRSRVAFVNERPRSCQARTQGAHIRFHLNIGVTRPVPDRSADSLDLITGPIGRDGDGLRADVRRYRMVVGGANPPGPQSGDGDEIGTVRFTDDLSGGTATVTTDPTVTIDFTCGD